MISENAIIDYERISVERGSFLTAGIGVEYGDGGKQGFGGEFCQPFLLVCFQTAVQAEFHIAQILKCAGVDQWHKIVGKPVRTIHDNSRIISIGHITKDIWYTPSKELQGD